MIKNGLKLVSNFSLTGHARTFLKLDKDVSETGQRTKIKAIVAKFTSNTQTNPEDTHSDRLD